MDILILMNKEYSHAVDYINNFGDNILLLQNASPKLFTEAIKTLPVVPTEMTIYFGINREKNVKNTEWQSAKKKKEIMPLDLTLEWNGSTFNPSFAQNQLLYALPTETSTEEAEIQYQKTLNGKIADGGKFEGINIFIAQNGKNKKAAFSILQKAILPTIVNKDYEPHTGFLTVSSYKSFGRTRQDAHVDYVNYRGIELTLTQKTREEDKKILIGWMNNLASPPRK